MRADATLMAIATGGVFQDYAPLGTTAPFIIVAQQSSVDVNTVNGVRMFTNKLMQIKAIGPSSGFAALVAAVDRIDTLFKNVRNAGLPSGGVLASTRESELSYSEIINGAAWSHLGALYRVELQGV